MMDWPVVRTLVGQKLRERGTYTLTLVVGTVINLYGQILVPWLRGSTTPLDDMVTEASIRPLLMVTSIVLGYTFPLLVSVYSAVVTRYRSRGVESRSNFPDLKPDPVFRAALDGTVTDSGATTRVYFETHGIKRAQDILGDETWGRITAGEPELDHEQLTIYFAPDDAHYIVSYSACADGALNLYLTRLIQKG